jgi:beta-glucosidase
VVVLNTGGPVLTPWLARVAGVIEVWYPGQEYGGAIARLLFGDVNPSGKLPMTWPASSKQGPASANADLDVAHERYNEGILVGYRWFDAKHQKPLFAFGDGLSYTRFRYRQLRVTSKARTFRVSARITNTGGRAGAEVAQLYIGMPKRAQEPPKQLKGYARLALRRKHTKVVRFKLRRSDLAVWRKHGGWTAVPGRYRVMIGSSSRDIRLNGRLTLR